MESGNWTHNDEINMLNKWTDIEALENYILTFPEYKFKLEHTREIIQAAKLRLMKLRAR